MAVTFSLTSTGLTTIDFTSATDFVFQDDYYVPVVITPTGDGSIPPYVTETLPVMVNATTDNDLALTMQELAALQKRAAEYWVDQQQAIPVLLNCKLDAETTGRQALVKAIHFEWKPSIHAMYRECSIPPGWALGTVLIERHPYWERTTARIFPNVTPAAAAAVVYDYTGYGPELASNIGFETVAAGPDWANWAEAVGDGALADEGAIKHGGAHACKQTAGASANTYVSQTLTVTPNQTYLFLFWTYGDGANAGRYSVYDLTHTAYIIAPTTTEWPWAAWNEFYNTFDTPAGCTQVVIYLQCPVANGGIVYYDDVTVKYYVHDIAGDVPARVNALAVKSATGGATLERYWMGIRGIARHGATGVTNFVPVWECEDGVNIGDTSITDDGGGSEPNTASPGSGNGDYVIINPGAGGTAIDWSDGDFHMVFNVGLGHIGYGAGTYPDAAGRFICLLRAKMQTAGNEWHIRVRSGSVSSVQNYHDPVKLASTSWNYYQLAVVSIPMRNKQALDSALLATDVDYDALFIEAKQISGSGDLYLDCLCLIPVDEGYAYIIDALTNTTRCVFVGEGPKGDTQALQVDNVTVYSNEAFEFEHFRLPPGDGRIICTYARSVSSVFTDQAEFADVAQGTSAYTERWTALRGAE